MWKYVREKNLQDPTNKRKILCDDTMRKLFSVESIGMFQTNKALAKHIWPLDESIQQKIKSEERTGPASEEDVSTTRKEGAEAEDEDEGRMEKGEGKKKRSNFLSICFRSSKNGKDIKKRGGGFNKPCSLSPQLQVVIGEAELGRPDLLGFQINIVDAVASDCRLSRSFELTLGRRICRIHQTSMCDELLRPMFSVDSINMFKMNETLSKHIWPINEDALNNSQKEEKSKRRRDECDEDETEQKDKKPKKGGSGLTAALPLSDALVKFLGTGKSELSRSDVVKRMWKYIKENGLQDPSDKRMIICDDKLRALQS